MIEQWRPVADYENYEVSNLGRFRRGKHVLKTNRPKDNYLRIYLYRSNVRKTFLAHRVVALSWIGPCPIGMEVDHIDGDRSNNYASNLRYLTKSQNLKAAASRVGSKNWRGSGERHPMAKLSTEQVDRIRFLHETAGLNQRFIAEQVGIHFTTVNKILKGKLWKS